MHHKFSWPATDADGICLSQTIGAAGALTINGVLLDSVGLYNSPIKARKAVMGNSVQRTVSITSTDDQSAVDLTIVGIDLYGNAVTETKAIGNNTTVYTSAEYAEVTSVTASAAITTAITVGSGTSGNTRWWAPNKWANPTTISLYLVIGGTISVTVQDTPVNINQTLVLPTTAQIFNHPTLATKTTSDSSNYAFCPGAIRLAVASGSGTCEFTIIQAG